MPRSAFSLLEVMMAVSVLVIALMAIFSAIGTAAQTNRTTADEILVLEAIEAAIEEIQTVSYTMSLRFDGTSYTVPGVEGANGDEAVVRISIDEIVDGAGDPTGALDVTIDADWLDMQGPRSHMVRYIHTIRGGG